jgi:hypothetical protein
MNDTICSEQIDANIILVPDTSSIIWTVGNIPGIKGSTGSEKYAQSFKYDRSRNICQYKIRAVGGDGCVATQLDILVYPEVTSNIDDQFVCSDSLIEYHQCRLEAQEAHDHICLQIQLTTTLYHL